MCFTDILIQLFVVFLCAVKYERRTLPAAAQFDVIVSWNCRERHASADERKNMWIFQLEWVLFFSFFMC